MPRIRFTTAEERRLHKKAYYREYQIKHRARLSQHNRDFRDRHRPILRIKWATRIAFKRWEDWERMHKQERKHYLSKKYWIIPATYDEMLSQQNGVCDICKRPEQRNGRRRYLSVDHDHSSGKIRALLCHGCNTTVGVIREDVTVLQAMIAYILKHQ